MTSLFLTCEIGVAGWQKSLRKLTAGAEKKTQKTKKTNKTRKVILSPTVGASTESTFDQAGIQTGVRSLSYMMYS